MEKKGDEAKVVLRYLEHIISDEHSGVDEPAGIIVEPVQGEGGYIVPPQDFLPGLREIADKYQIPLICDEVQSGFGRTGKFWGCEADWNHPGHPLHLQSSRRRNSAFHDRLQVRF